MVRCNATKGIHLCLGVSGYDMRLVRVAAVQMKKHFTPYEYAMYEYVDMYTSMYSSRLMELCELCELCDLPSIT